MACTIPGSLQKRVLLTRPYADSLKLQESLHQRGIECVISPVLEIIPFSLNQMNLGHFSTTYDGIILTSRHALSCLIALSTPLDTRLFVVGSSTELACRQEGYSQIKVANQSVQSLISLILKEGGKDKRFLYLRGKDITVDLKNVLLQKERIQVDEVLAYEARAVKTLNPKVVKDLQEGSLTDVVFYSLRSARIFMDLVKRQSLESSLFSLTAHAISQPVLDFLQEDQWQDRKLF